MNQSGFFDLQERYQSLSACGDPLEVLAAKIPWERFRPTLKRALEKQRRKEPRKSEAGRKPYDAVLMFKIMVLQSLYNLSDHQAEFQIKDRLSFMRFLNLSLPQSVPDEKTIWLFREMLTKAGAMEKLFERFNRYLEQEGYSAKKGQIVDASIVEVPRQRNTRDENEKIKQDETPSEWENQLAKKRQKDTNARWTKKHGKDFFGYKNHINVDVKHKLIRKYAVTPAPTHDSRAMDDLLDKKNSGRSIWGDSAYRSEEIDLTLKARKLTNRIHYKGYRNHPLSEHKKSLNRARSRIRARVEHVFGFQSNTMRAGQIRCIGLARAAPKIALANLVYNMMRYLQLSRSTA
jgi:IS5 family transposase